jgi:hypothetical protein
VYDAEVAETTHEKVALSCKSTTYFWKPNRFFWSKPTVLSCQTAAGCSTISMAMEFAVRLENRLMFSADDSYE